MNVCKCGSPIAPGLHLRWVHTTRPNPTFGSHYAVAVLTDVDKLLAKVDRSAGPDGCWPWQGSIRKNGYGMFGSRDAHRQAYELLIGAVPDGLQLDHLCRNPPCCNPAHLEPVTPRENTLRGISFSAVNAKKTHCRRGHPYDAANTYHLGGRRYCRECTRINGRAYYARVHGLPTSRREDAPPSSRQAAGRSGLPGGR